MGASAFSALFQLCDLVSHRELGLEMVAGDDGILTRPVSGAHAIEIADPARWLAPDWVMLTTGVRLVGDRDAQDNLPRELADAGVAAIGFAYEFEFAVAPDPLLRAADEIGFPIFAVPLPTAFRDIEAFVHRSLLSSDLRSMQRLSSMQRFLVDALYTPNPQSTVLERLAELCQASVAVISYDGQVEEQVGDIPSNLETLLVDPGPGLRETELDDCWIAQIPIPAPDAGARWLVAAHTKKPSHHRIIRSLLNTTAPLLAAIGRLEETARRQDLVTRRSLLSDLINCCDDERSLVARAAGCGIDIEAPSIVVQLLARSETLDRPAAERLERRTAQLLAANGHGHLTMSGEDCVFALVTGTESLSEELLCDLAADDAAIGVGRKACGPLAIAESAADARVAAGLVTETAQGVPWRSYNELDLAALVVGHLPLDRLRPQIEEIIAAIDSRPGLREALNAYLKNGLEVKPAAHSLYLHPNSLRYRLNRLEDALGRPLRDARTITALVLTLELQRRRPDELPSVVPAATGDEEVAEGVTPKPG